EGAGIFDKEGRSKRGESAMRIDNYHLTNLFVGLTGEAAAPDDAARREIPDRFASDASLHVPSSQLSEWLSLVNQTPEIRPEVVARAAADLAAGTYLTSLSAEQTAAAILR